jgi:Membrane domain of glycerophosphoryl diester phosphodiesterase
MATMHLRPRSFSELIDATFEIIRARLRPIATVGGLMILPGAIMSLVMATMVPELMTPSRNPQALQALGAKFWMIFLVLFPISTVVYALGSTALVAIASSAYLGGHADVAEGFALARRRMWPVIGTWLLKALLVFAPFMALTMIVGVLAKTMGTAGTAAGGVLVFLGMLAWLVLAPILLLRWAVSMPVAALESAGPSAALRRSGVLTKGSKGRLFGLYIVFFLVFFAMYAVGAMIGGMTGAMFDSPTFANVLGNIMSMVLYPLLAVLQTVVYYDLRIRTEGFDLEVMAGGLSDAATGGVLPAAGATPRQTA